MKEDIIRQIKTAEDQAEEKRAEAKVRAEKIIHDARHQAVELRLEIIESARADAKTLFEQGMKKFEPQLDKVSQTFQENIANDNVQAQKTFDGAVEFVVTKFRERLGSE